MAGAQSKDLAVFKSVDVKGTVLKPDDDIGLSIRGVHSEATGSAGAPNGHLRFQLSSAILLQPGPESSHGIDREYDASVDSGNRRR